MDEILLTRECGKSALTFNYFMKKFGINIGMEIGGELFWYDTDGNKHYAEEEIGDMGEWQK